MIRKLLFTAFLVCAAATLAAQDKTAFNGIITDKKGAPLKRAHVWVKTEKDYALTDREGRFGLTNVLPTDTLHIKLKKTTWLIPVNGKRSIRLQLTDQQTYQSQEDEQLVSFGFGFVTRREFTGTSNYISGEELRRSGYNDVLSALQGRIPGLNITGTSGNGGANQNVSMRGTRSFTADQTPAMLIDSTVVPNFEGLNLNDIDYVEIMKDASIYGSAGANGAIIVHTKYVEK